MPPPRHGVSAVNEAVARIARERGIKVVQFNTSARSLHRTLALRAARLFRVAQSMVRVWGFALRSRGGVVYLALSGGWGLLYEIVCASGARLLGARLVAHHHSFRYIDAEFWPMSLFVRMAGVQTRHVVLGADMERQLRDRYPAMRKVLVLSNAFAMPAQLENLCLPTGLRKVGYLSNLSSAKGLDDVLDTITLSNQLGLGLQFVVAGPFDDPQVKRNFQERAKNLPNLEYLGPVYGADKDRFFRTIDLLVFPTRYQHEAEPLVVLEALCYGRPVIAYARGCIPSLLAGSGGMAVPQVEQFPLIATDCFRQWGQADGGFCERAQMAHKRYVELKQGSDDAIRELLELA